MGICSEGLACRPTSDLLDSFLSTLRRPPFEPRRAHVHGLSFRYSDPAGKPTRRRPVVPALPAHGPRARLYAPPPWGILVINLGKKPLSRRPAARRIPGRRRSRRGNGGRKFLIVALEFLQPGKPIGDRHRDAVVRPLPFRLSAAGLDCATAREHKAKRDEHVITINGTGVARLERDSIWPVAGGELQWPHWTGGIGAFHQRRA